MWISSTVSGEQRFLEKVPAIKPSTFESFPRLEMIADADKDGDGRISFDEFKEKMLLFGATCGQALVGGGAGATGEQSGNDAAADDSVGA